MRERILAGLLAFTILALVAGEAATGFAYYQRSNAYNVLLEAAVRFQQACIASGPACTEKYENKSGAWSKDTSKLKP